MSRYMKTIIAVLGGISAWGMTAAADNAITAVELFGLLGALATALGVYAIPNTPPKGEPRDAGTSETQSGGQLGAVALSSAVFVAAMAGAFLLGYIVRAIGVGT